MKFPAAYYLVLLYATVLLKPLMPFISDAWSHEFNGIEHISLVHAKYGSNHLQKELADANADSDRSKNHNTVKLTNEVSFHVPQSVVTYTFFKTEGRLHYLIIQPDKLPFVSIFQHAPPPKFS